MNKIFSKTIAALLFPSAGEIFAVEEWGWVIYVHGQHISRFVSKTKFLEKFFELRRERAQKLQAYRLSEFEFRVNNPENGNSYNVEFKGRRVTCQCEDYKMQLQALGTGACKHIYACLKGMGYSSLREYMNAIGGKECK